MDEVTMTPEACQRIGQIFGVTLPDWYRQCLDHYPFAKPDDALYPDEAGIIEANEKVRRDGWFGMPWPPEFFVIGDTGCGDWFFIVPARGDRRIFIADHEGGPVPDPDQLDQMVQSETLAQYVAETHEIIREGEKWAERRRNKKWWQFWI